ncbi:TPA: LysR family transcriptional regulator [Vibrio vulnificus]|nr:LysR family transcriptional regulator [Vibrio vulnificus]HDY7662244.1 LysR family transcriptional regulator [Vibrio vulnificus]HDY7696162.1 LysR family transcriptional regulator [Vibrio vulnificus]HDY7737343.1 LysR family transcriptional regulator [Vibrio vulnificus]HDY7971269.1 LysR family transcriptional regulator [Vibrio vulnificus]
MKDHRKMIDVKYLKTFSHVAKHRSFTVAAESLYMTQPAVSQHIKKIENTIGASIFNRKERFGLTQHGKVLLEYADQTMSMHEKLFQDLERLTERAKYNIAISDSFCPLLVEKVVDEFRAINNIDLEITSFNTISAINAKNFDVVFSLSRLLSEGGASYQLKASNFAIIHSLNIDLKECHPNRVVYCNSLSKSTVMDLLRECSIDASFVSGWIGTNSARLLSAELKNYGTIVVCPEWSVGIKGVNKISTSQQVTMNVWFSDDMEDEFEKIGIKSKIKRLFNQYH